MKMNSSSGRFLRRVSREVKPPLSQHGTAATPRKIAFAAISAGAGATTLCCAAAEFLARRAAASKAPAQGSAFPTVLEIANIDMPPSGYPYDKLGMDRHFAGRSFVSYYRLAKEGGPISGYKNSSGGVNWALRVPGEPAADAALEIAELVRLIGGISGEPVLCDIAQNLIADEESARILLACIDRLICIIDPLPSRLLAGSRAIEQVRAAEARGLPVVYVLNKMNCGVNLREVRRFLALKEPLFVPALPFENICAAEYACRTLATEPAIAQSLAALFPAA